VDSLRFRYVHKTYFLKSETFHKIFNFIFNYNQGSLRGVALHLQLQKVLSH
jgi:hypothetical protein